MGKVYRGEFSNSQVLYLDNSGFEQTVIVLIDDTADTSGGELDIEMAENPVTIRVVDNNEDKFTPIRSKSAEIRIHTTPNVNIMTFGGGGDNQYKVQICINAVDNIIFEGWLSISDLRQDFQPDPNVLVLTATDGLGFLKDLPLTDVDGNEFSGMHRISEYIAGCLAKTGLQKTLIAEMNVKESTQPTNYLGHLYHTIYLDARTFEKSINEFEDCFSVLEKILGEYCELSQQKNEWYIRAIDEFDWQNSIQVRFNYNGTIMAALPEVSYNKEIGSNMTLYQMGFMNDDAQVFLQRPYKYVKHIYNFEPPAELPCNVDFERGDFIANLPDETIDGATYTAKKYSIECWDLLKGSPATFSTFPTGEAYTKKLFDQFENIHSTFAVIKWPTSPPEALVFRSSPIRVNYFDKFELSWDISIEQNLSIGTGNLIVASVLLEGDNGTYWFLDDPVGLASTTLNFPSVQGSVCKWYQSNANWTSNYRLLSINVDTNTIDNSQFRTIGISDVEPFPVAGNLYLIFHWGNDVTFASSTLQISNINFSYIAQINGSYRKYRGQENMVEQAGEYKATREKQVFLSDGPKYMFKGCLQKRVGDYLVIGGAQATVTFYLGNGFELPGYWVWLFKPGMQLLIAGTTLNNTNETFVLSTLYLSALNKTVVYLSTATVYEVDSNYAISSLKYGFPEGFYNAAVNPAGPPDPTYIKPYGQIQVEAVWNQFNRVFSSFEGTIDGLDTYVLDSLDRYDLPDLMHSFFLRDQHDATNNKKFKLLHFDQDPDLCEWNGVFVEVFDYTIPKVYTGHSFKYLTNE